MNDPTCRLEVNGPYNTQYWSHRSVIKYNFARIETVSDIYAITPDNSHFICKWPLSVVDRAASGLAISKAIPMGIKQKYITL